MTDKKDSFWDDDALAASPKGEGSFWGDDVAKAPKADLSSLRPDLAKEMAGYGENAKGAWDAVTHGRLPIGANVPVLGPAVKKLASMPAAAVAALTGDKSFSENLDRLSAERDAEDAQFAKEHPTANGLSELAGAAALPVPPALTAAEGAGTLARAGIGAANAGIRAGTNTALSAADAAVRGGDPAEAAKRAALISGGLELVGGAAGQLGRTGASAGETLGAAGDIAKEIAEAKAFKAAVGNQAKAYNEAADRGVINQRGRELLDEGVVGFGDSAQQIAAKAKVNAKASGEGIGSLLESIDKTAPRPMVSGPSMATELRTYAGEVGGSGNKALVARLQEAADDLEARGNMTFAKAQIEKDSWNWEPGSSLTKVAARRVKAIIGQEMEDAIGRLGEAPAQPFSVGRTDGTKSTWDGTWPAPPEAAPEPPSQFGQSTGTGGGRPRTQPSPDVTWKEAELAPSGALTPEQQQQVYQQLKSKYGTMKAAAKDAQVTANRYDKNNSASLGDKAAAAAGMALNPHGTVAKVATGAAAGIANKLIRKRGNSAAAVSFDKIGDMLKATPEFFGKYAAPLLQSAARGDQALAVTHYLLMQQDPTYQKLIGGEGD